ncbi:hypothetical protein CDAR_281481 [Caerostris darwini]|uniref:Uncharacterized protein n=1 Tax=Caerostris darwini TaxID=1538125 RepID=A0AAV4QWU9_9ARAC|nr:hypothetical protein CDAR_281481 [Caerostris darwini]
MKCPIKATRRRALIMKPSTFPRSLTFLLADTSRGEEILPHPVKASSSIRAGELVWGWGNCGGGWQKIKTLEEDICHRCIMSYFLFSLRRNASELPMASAK